MLLHLDNCKGSVFEVRDPELVEFRGDAALTGEYRPLRVKAEWRDGLFPLTDYVVQEADEQLELRSAA